MILVFDVGNTELTIGLFSEAELRRVAQHHTRNLEAYQYYQRGQMALLVRRPEENELAKEMFRRAIALDASFALPYAALAQTYASWHRIRDVNAAPGYARTILVNTATSWFRKKGWRNERPTETLPETGYEHDPSDRPSMVAALAQLPARQRAVIVLRFYDDLSVAQTAHALGCTEGTVKSQTHDALARLRTLLGDAVVPHTLGARHD